MLSMLRLLVPKRDPGHFRGAFLPLLRRPLLPSLKPHVLGRSWSYENLSRLRLLHQDQLGEQQPGSLRPPLSQKPLYAEQGRKAPLCLATNLNPEPHEGRLLLASHSSLPRPLDCPRSLPLSHTHTLRTSLRATASSCFTTGFSHTLATSPQGWLPTISSGLPPSCAMVNPQDPGCRRFLSSRTGARVSL